MYMESSSSSTHVVDVSNAGHYMYIESSSPRHSNDKAQMYSKPYNPTGGSCLTFWYNMYGQDVGTLNLYVIPMGASLTNPLWSLSGDQGSHWRLASLNVHSIERFQVSGRHYFC